MLLPKLLSPAEATASLRRLRPTAAQLTDFKNHLAEMLRHLDPNKIERHGETHILDFLRQVSRPAEGGTRYGNVKDKRDLVLHLGDTADTPVAVVLEVKGPKNPKEMLAPADLNRKALHQLLLYYLEDRTDDKADDFRRLIVTTGYEWYIFDALHFDRLFWKDRSFVKDFQDWKAGAKASKGTDFFYDSIAGKKLLDLSGELPVVYADLRPGLPTKQTELQDLYRLFHPAYLLKEPLTGRRDPNTLNQEFYNELLYLMGLKEDKQGTVRRIQRCPPAERQSGSLLENTLRKLETGHGLNYLPEADRLGYGDTPETQREGVALALCLMWVNRLLFLKLLEGQLVRYHPQEAAEAFRFLTPARLGEYDDVQTLFFEVLNRPTAERTPDVAAEFPQVPYLNSSLFEPSQLEGQTIDISGLRDGLGLAPFPGSVLSKKGAPKVPPGKGHSSAAPQWAALPYLLLFLDAYDFATDPTTSHAAPATGTAPEAPRPLLSAAVLGLVFEKINGYKDGSFYTPGFVTMYMARQTLGRAVLRHFRQAPAFPELAACDSLEELADALTVVKRERRLQYARHFNTLTVLDPAVGSGHFLVSALNELLALKSRLHLFVDEQGALLPYTLDVEHDELVVTDQDGNPAPYRVGTFDAATGARKVGPQRTQLQQALFREKRALMEHALFGVDLNPNSVRICRLRLWIELLKHAYYKPETDYQELETLPNLDLNVKTGNSLLARFPLDADLSEVFKKGGFTPAKYKQAVHDYFGSRGSADKARLLGFFEQLKQQFTAVLHKKDPKREKLRLARNQRIVLDTQVSLIPETKKQEEARYFEMRRLELLANQLQNEIDAHEQGAQLRDAFEWRFEFPEVLDEAGDFRGFDVVIGNPPYVTKLQNKSLKEALSKRFVTSQYQLDLYVAFIEMSTRLLKAGGVLSFITPNSWLKNMMFTEVRKYVLDNLSLHMLIPNMPKVFAEANVDSAILIADKSEEQQPLEIGRVENTQFYSSHFVDTSRFRTNERNVFDVEMSENATAIIQIIRQSSVQLHELCDITRGVNSYDKARGQSDEVIKNRAYHADFKKDETYVPELKGKHVKPYAYHWDGTTYISYGTWLAAPREAKYFEGTRLVMRQVLGATLFCTLIKEDMVIDQSVFIAKLKKGRTDYSMDYILGVLASPTTAYYFKHSANEFDELFPKIKIGEFRELPIPTATPTQQAHVAGLVKQILDAKAADPAADTHALEAQVDAAVADLYGVTIPPAPAG